MDGTPTTPNAGDDDDQGAEDAATAEQPQLQVPTVGDQCASCGARLARDQRYCVECGERSGKPRYTLPAAAAAHAPGKPAHARRRRLPRLSESGALIAGVGTLLLAMGVGVLIGRDSNSASQRTPGYQIVTVGASGTPTTSAATASAASKSSATKRKSKNKGKSKSPVFKKIPKKLQSSAVKLGQKGTGRGYTNGHFTGTFFGPGQ